ncbi:MAG: DNA-processing protein DprA [Halioglobus sp.]
MDVLDARLCLMLHSLPGLGDLPLSRLFLQYGSAQKIWDSDPGRWTSLGVSAESVSAAQVVQSQHLSSAGPPGIDRQLDSLVELGAQVISLTDARYPALLQRVYDPPPILYARGEIELLQQAQLGIVGSRKASLPGLKATSQLSGQLVQAGLHICSGLALGIDHAAHRGALDAGGKTVAVVANGLDVIYPARHRAITQEIVGSGCLLSECPPGCEPLRHRFPKRNRIISGLSLGVLVVEAALRSGSLITARTAMEQGREVFALPWSVFHIGGRGCLGLIRDGVKMVLGVEDILEELGPLYQCQSELAFPEPKPSQALYGLQAGEVQVLRLIGAEAIGVDELVQHSGLAVSRVLAILSSLEVARKIVRCDGGYIEC